MRVIVTFFTISEVLKFERLMKEEGLSLKLMPVPRNLSTSCGTCAQISKEDLPKAKALMDDKDLEYDEIHLVSED